MTDDFSTFWQNDARAYALFQDLLGRSEDGAYDDDFLAQLAAYREASPDSERADIFAAQYLLANGDAEGAALCGSVHFAAVRWSRRCGRCSRVPMRRSDALQMRLSCRAIR